MAEMNYRRNSHPESSPKAGFTIVELIIVVIIISLLATIVVVAYRGIRERAVEASQLSDLKNAAEIIDVEKTRVGSYPIDASSANNGVGLETSGSNTITYVVEGDIYCVAVYSPLTKKTFNYQNTTRETKSGVCPALVASGWKETAASDSYTCGISSGNVLYCWGAGVSSPAALGAGAIPTGAILSGLTAGSGHFCVTGDGKAYCWGDNTNGRVGDGTTTNRTTPVAVAQGAMAAGTIVTYTAAGGNSSCALTSTGLVYCWGYGASGALGRGVTTNSFTPVAIVAGSIPGGVTATKLAAGGSNACIIGSNNLAYCWGDATNGSLGNGATMGQSNSPTAVSQGALPAGYSLTALTVGGSHSCVLIPSGAAYCWGVGFNGRLGQGASANSATPVAVLGGISFLKISGGVYTTCGVAVDSTGYCWGTNAAGQLGNGNNSNWYFPQTVQQGARPSGVTFKDIVPGDTHACGTASNGKAYCWGDGSGGELGHGSLTSSNIPVEVSITP